MQFDRTPEIASKLVADSDNNLNSISFYILHHLNLHGDTVSRVPGIHTPIHTPTRVLVRGSLVYTVIFHISHCDGVCIYIKASMIQISENESGDTIVAQKNLRLIFYNHDLSGLN